jgi:hypothetical protein
MRMVHQPPARRLRHGDLSGQDTGNIPCRVSVSIPSCHVARGYAVGPTVRALANVPVISLAYASLVRLQGRGLKEV